MRVCVCVLNHNAREMEEEVRYGEGQGEIGKGGSASHGGCQRSRE